MSVVISQILTKFASQYRWSAEPEGNPFAIGGWDIIVSNHVSDEEGFCGGAVLYRVPQIEGLDRYAKIVTNFDEVLSIEWANSEEDALKGPLWGDLATS